MDKKEMRNLFDGDCSPAEEQAAGRWLAEHAETKEADELLYALLRETKPATADAEGAFRRVCRRLGIAPKSSAWRLVGRWTMRAAACLLLPVAALAFYLYGEAQRPGEWFEAYAPYGKTLRVVLPRVEGDAMRFYACRPDALVFGAFGILEPQGERPCPAGEIDLVVCPGVAFTADGRRLGRGRGYYDRYLGDPAFRGFRVGVCYAHQLVDDLPVEPHDVRMDRVITG